MLEKLTDRIYYLPGEEKTDRPYLYYIRGDYASLAVDAGNSEQHVAAFYRELENQGLPKPIYTVITHWHWDHTFGMHAVSGKTIASVKTNLKLRQVQSWEWTLEKMLEREEAGLDIRFCTECIRAEYDDLGKIVVTLADHEVEDEMIIELGGVTCILECSDSPHSRDALLLYVPEEKALFVGDADCEDHYDNGGRYDRDKLTAYIDSIEPMDICHYLLGHDRPQNKAEVLEYLKACLCSLQTNS